MAQNEISMLDTAHERKTAKASKKSIKLKKEQKIIKSAEAIFGYRSVEGFNVHSVLDNGDDYYDNVVTVPYLTKTLRDSLMNAFEWKEWTHMDGGNDDGDDEEPITNLGISFHCTSRVNITFHELNDGCGVDVNVNSAKNNKQEWCYLADLLWDFKQTYGFNT